MKVSRRLVLKGLGGVALSLPFLEGLRGAFAQDEPLVDPFAIFFRQANGVSTASSGGALGDEPERFWPRSEGALTAASVEGRALAPLTSHLGDLLVIDNINMEYFDFGDGHARGALQALTAQGPVVEDAGGDSEAAGESLDHRIGRELNPDGRDSLFLYAGRDGGWLEGPCISYRASGVRRSAIRDPWNAYQTVVGGETGLSAEAQLELAERRRSVNDLVREQMQALLSRPELSADDRRRLDLHQSSIRDVEVALGCRMSEEEELALMGAASALDSTDGEAVLETARLHMDVAALAVACGHTRSVAIQVGNGNDGDTRYFDPVTSSRMENFHYVSHRQLSHGSDGEAIPDSDRQHFQVDLQFAETFAHLLDRLDQYELSGGETLKDHGVAVWYNDLGSGPGHRASRVPFIIGGSAGGFLQQGRYIVVEDEGDARTHARLLNTIGSAVGLRSASSEMITDFGDPSLPRTPLTDLLA